jgi:hypothetical protein
MPLINSPLSTRSGSRVGEVMLDLLAWPAQPAPGKVDSAYHHRQHVVEIVGDAAGKLADRLHLLDLAELRFGGLTLCRFFLQRLVRFPQFLGALAHRFLERGGAVGFALGLTSRRGDLPEGLNGERTEEDRPDPDDEAKPAEIIGQAVGLGREQLRFGDPFAQRDPLGFGDLVELAVKGGTGW